MKKQKEIKQLFGWHHEFTEAELKEKSVQLARACRERNEQEDAKKSAMSNFKDKIDSKTSEINIISNHINTGKEWVDRSCDVVFDFAAGIKTFYFEGERVGADKITSSDHQLELEIEEVEKSE